LFGRLYLEKTHHKKINLMGFAPPLSVKQWAVVFRPCFGSFQIKTALCSPDFRNPPPWYL
jgi:hypothetical protein